ncbi:GTP-binding protein [Butyrivibrio sp. DSM 10294]|uniref:GTP-binding protein n=1 Tax=Butyrivibrio sp. DSM 10294 TaxID=2972457 RepID=UPI00234EB1F6|nr:GTP-binding protein [Butyrivibrio sp. DSM 10294]
MQILLISGFLGAGKTTFIKELIKRTDKRPVILENEYGANNLDSLELQKTAEDSGKKEELKVLEFMEGCVCCTMKDSFVNSVLAIFSSLSPEYLIIEPTGVGRLSSIIENLKPILGRVNYLLEPVVVLSPSNFRSNMKEWPELYADQVANAGKVVFSKCENTDDEELKAVTEEILKINPKAKVTDRHYSKMDEDWWRDILEAGGGVAGQGTAGCVSTGAGAGVGAGASIGVGASTSTGAGVDAGASIGVGASTSTGAGVGAGAGIGVGASTSAGAGVGAGARTDVGDGAVKGNGSNTGESTDSGKDTEALSQVSIDTAGFHNYGELIQLLEDCLHGEFGLVSRAKGTLWVGSEVLRFDLADKLYAIAASPDDNCQCVFIGKGLNEKKLRERLTGQGRRMLKR